MENIRLILLSLTVIVILSIPAMAETVQIDNARVQSDSVMHQTDLNDFNTAVNDQKEKLERLFGRQIRVKPTIRMMESGGELSAEYGLYVGSGGVSSKTEIAVLTPNRYASRFQALTILKHEYTHFYINLFYTKMPFYLNEGLAEYLSGMEVGRKELPIPENLFAWRVDDAESYRIYSTAAGRFLIDKMPAIGWKKMISWIETEDFTSIAKCYESYFRENARQIRVMMRPMKADKITILFKGGAKVVVILDTNGHTLTNIVTNIMEVGMKNTRLMFQNQSVMKIEVIPVEEFRIGSNVYRGRIGFIQGNGEVRIVNTLPLETYLYSVVASEMPGIELEGLKAQAILARTLARFRMDENRERDFDVSMLTSDQAYRGKNWETYFSRKATMETMSETMTYEGEWVYPFYSSTCGGHTASGMDVWGIETPFIESVECRVSNIDLCGDSPHFAQWKQEITRTELSQILQTDVLQLTVGVTNAYGRVRTIWLNGKEYSFQSLRTTLGKAKGWFFLKANLVKILEKKIDGETIYEFVGKGLGHGVGMCQYGAMKLAGMGWKAEEIVRFYYKNVCIERFRE